MKRMEVALVMALGVLPAFPAGAQIAVRDLVITLGTSVEAYTGNLNVFVESVDSADRAVAVVGEGAVRGVVGLIQDPDRERDIEMSFDLGVRQAAAMGFASYDYAPREMAGSVGLRYQESLGNWGRMLGRAGFRGRSVSDRPPMPLYLQSGYEIGTVSLGVVTRSFDGLSIDAGVEGETADYQALDFQGQVKVDLLDRRGVGANLGARWGTSSTVRFHTGVRWLEYRHQTSGDPEDPFRRDRTLDLGLEWTYLGSVFAQAGLVGTRNRSNGNRPEYDALSLEVLFDAPLPWRSALNVRAVVTGKSYVHETEFARLVPGEEADNASIAYVQLTRPLAENLDGAVRLGWTRAESDVGSAYYRRFGGSIHFNYRPPGF